MDDRWKKVFPNLIQSVGYGISAGCVVLFDQTLKLLCFNPCCNVEKAVPARVGAMFPVPPDLLLKMLRDQADQSVKVFVQGMV